MRVNPKANTSQMSKKRADAKSNTLAFVQVSKHGGDSLNTYACFSKCNFNRCRNDADDASFWYRCEIRRARAIIYTRTALCHSSSLSDALPFQRSGSS